MEFFVAALANALSSKYVFWACFSSLSSAIVVPWEDRFKELTQIWKMTYHQKDF